MNNVIKLYAVMVESSCEPPIHEWIYLDRMDATEKFNDLIAKELLKDSSYDYITLRQFPAGGDVIDDGEDLRGWNPKKRRVEGVEECKARRG